MLNAVFPSFEISTTIRYPSFFQPSKWLQMEIEVASSLYQALDLVCSDFWRVWSCNNNWESVSFNTLFDKLWYCCFNDWFCFCKVLTCPINDFLLWFQFVFKFWKFSVSFIITWIREERISRVSTLAISLAKQISRSILFPAKNLLAIYFCKSNWNRKRNNSETGCTLELKSKKRDPDWHEASQGFFYFPYCYTPI